MNVSKPVFISAILLGLVSGLLISQVFNVTAAGGHYRGNPLHDIWEAIAELQTKVDTLEERVETLEDQSLPQGFVTAPAYDSGWFTAETSSWFEIEHNLGTTELLVYVIRNDSDGSPRDNYGINQMGYMKQTGWLWLTENSIWVAIAELGGSDQVRVMIWKISEP